MAIVTWGDLVIPVFDMAQLPPVDLHQNGFVPDEAWEEDGSPEQSNQEYGDWHEVSGPELDMLLEWETRELRRLDRESLSAEEFERNASDLESDPQDTGWDATEHSHYYDFGIVSCVAALNFLGVPTTSSCRGHYGSWMGRDVPYVRFVGDDIDEGTWKLIKTSTSKSGCQLAGCKAGLIEIIGRSCADLLEFARLVREARPFDTREQSWERGAGRCREPLKPLADVGHETRAASRGPSET